MSARLLFPEDEGLSSYALILFDFRLFEQGHIQKAHEVFKRCGDSPVLVFVTEKTVAFAAKILKLGASDVIVFPCCRSYLQAYIRYYASKPEEFSVPDITGAHVLKAFIGVSEASAVLKKQILLASQNDMPVLLLGETGTGKSLAAHLIHDLSRRKKSSFVEENIAAIQETLVEGELFGTKAGAYTGAVTRPGLFERASGGTLFLDEIGEIDQNVQIKILRVLQDKRFERVGGEETLEVDVRVIAATNRDLEAEIAAGRFREDLYYRLNVVHIHVPPLRDRRDDIPLLITAFLQEFAKENGKTIEGIDSRARSALYKFDWPGNIRQLRNCLESAVVMSSGPIIKLEDLPPSIAGSSQTDIIEVPAGIPMSEAEKMLILQNLAINKGNKTKTADILGIGRKTLHRKLDEYAGAGKAGIRHE